jgi:hypothetical protein
MAEEKRDYTKSCAENMDNEWNNVFHNSGQLNLEIWPRRKERKTRENVNDDT